MLETSEVYGIHINRKGRSYISYEEQEKEYN